MANTPEVISLSSSEVLLGSTIILTSSGGENVASVAMTWSCNGHTGTGTLGNFTFTSNTFEPYAPTATYMNVVFTLTSTFDDTTTASTTATCKVNIPESYGPYINLGTITHSNVVNGHTRAPSTAVVNFTAGITGSATYAITVTELTTVAPITPQISTNQVVMVCPTVANTESYTVAFKILVTDSRGRTASVTISSARFTPVYCYDAPSITVTNIIRCDENGNEKPNGKYAKITGTITDTASTKYSCTCLINNITYNVTTYNIGTYSVICGNNALDLGINYPFTISYISQAMHTAGYTAITVTGTVSMQKVPLSLIDDGSVMGVSIGDMADDYNDTSSDVVLNIAANAEMRATNGSTSVVETAYNVVNCKNYVEQTLMHNMKIWAGTQSEYNNIRNKDYSTIYFVY